MSFVCFPVEYQEERFLEEGIIATLNKDKTFIPGKNWFGLSSPIGLWNRQGLEGQTLIDSEMRRIVELIQKLSE